MEKLEPSCSLLHTMLDKKVDELHHRLAGVRELSEEHDQKLARLSGEIGAIKMSVLSSTDGVLQTSSSLHALRDDIRGIREQLVVLVKTQDSMPPPGTTIDFRKNKNYAMLSVVTAIVTAVAYVVQSLALK